MGILKNNLFVGKNGLLCPQRIGGTTTPCGLYLAVRTVCYRIALSHYNFFAILEKYNPENCTFFTPVGKMGFALHEMFEVSGLSMGSCRMMKYIPVQKNYIY